MSCLLFFYDIEEAGGAIRGSKFSDIKEIPVSEGSGEKKGGR